MLGIYHCDYDTLGLHGEVQESIKESYLLDIPVYATSAELTQHIISRLGRIHLTELSTSTAILNESSGYYTTGSVSVGPAHIKLRSAIEDLDARKFCWCNKERNHAINCPRYQ